MQERRESSKLNLEKKHLSHITYHTSRQKSQKRLHGWGHKETQKKEGRGEETKWARQGLRDKNDETDTGRRMSHGVQDTRMI